MQIVLILIVLLIGISLGYKLNDLQKHRQSVGTLRVDKSDPDGPYLFLELKTPPYVIEKLPRVILDVHVSNYISQK